MLLASNWGYFPFILFSIIGLFTIVFPGTVMMIRHYNASMGGSIFDNNLSFTKLSLIFVRLSGLFWILAGIYLLLLIRFDIKLFFK